MSPGFIRETFAIPVLKCSRTFNDVAASGFCKGHLYYKASVKKLYVQSWLINSKERLVKFRFVLIPGHEEPGHPIGLFEQNRIYLNSCLKQCFDNILGVRRTAFNRNHLLDIRIVLIGIIHALTQKNGFFHARGRFHFFTGKDLHLVPWLTFPGIADSRKHQTIQSRAVRAHGQVIFPIIKPLDAILGHRYGHTPLFGIAVRKNVLMKRGYVSNAFTHHFHIRQVNRTVAVIGRVDEMRNVRRIVSQHPGPQQVG